MFRLDLSAQTEGDFSPEPSFLSICFRYFPPTGKLEQMLKLIDLANEMAVTEVIHTHHTNYTCALHNKAGRDGRKETGINDCSRTN